MAIAAREMLLNVHTLFLPTAGTAIVAGYELNRPLPNFNSKV